MKKIVVGLVMICAALGTLSVKAYDPSMFALPERPIIYAIGDSITAGANVGGEQGSWAKIVADGLGGLYINDAVQARGSLY